MMMAEREQAADAVTAAQPSAPQPPITGAFQRKLIRTVELEAVVAEVDSASDRAQALAKRLGGYVAHVDIQSTEGERRARLTLRVPVERLDEALAELRRLAVRIEREQQGVQDVTEQWVDLDARLRTLRATETELRALLAESRRRGHKLEDIMAVYRELTEIRSRIEQIEGQLKSLDQLASLATIQVGLQPDESGRPVAGTGWRPGDTVLASLRALVAGLKGIGDALIVVIIVGLPILAVLGIPALLVRRWLRRRRLRAA